MVATRRGTQAYGTECGKDDTYYKWYGDGDSYITPDKIIETHDNWGYTAPDGTEWAIIGNDKGTSFQIVGEVLPRGFIQTAPERAEMNRSVALTPRATIRVL